MERAFGLWDTSQRPIRVLRYEGKRQRRVPYQPGALPQADIDRAFGPLEVSQMGDPGLEIRREAPKARTISAWGSAPGTESNRNKVEGLKARSIECAVFRPGTVKCRAIFFASLRDAFGTMRLRLIQLGQNGQTPGAGFQPDYLSDRLKRRWRAGGACRLVDSRWSRTVLG